MKNRVQELRKAARLSQEELAAITSLENGKYMASLHLAYRLARYFGMAIEEIFLFEEEEEQL